MYTNSLVTQDCSCLPTSCNVCKTNVNQHQKQKYKWIKILTALQRLINRKLNNAVYFLFEKKCHTVMKTNYHSILIYLNNRILDTNA